MSFIHRALIWCFMLTKRLYKKWSFLIVMLLIPATVLIYSAAAEREKGVLTVVLVQEDPQDEAATHVIEELLKSSQLILFQTADREKAAVEQVKTGKADAVWVFPKGLQEKIYDYVTTDKAPCAIVRVIVRQKNVALLLANEKLGGELFEQCARTYYLHYLRENADELACFSDEALLDFYDGVFSNEQLFSFSHINGEMIDVNDREGNYLLSPLRGLLGTLILVSGLATAIYYIRDDEAGSFVLLARGRKPFVELVYQLITLGNVGALSFACLMLLGLNGGLTREAALLILYPVCCASFCQLIRVLCGDMRPMAAVMPLIVVVVLAVCPIFYDFGALRFLQYLLPPTYYINGAYNDSFLLYMPIYAVACQMATALCRMILKRI